MAKEKGLTKGGRLSPRSLDNTGARRFLVVECDEGSEDTQAAILSRLGRFLPLVLVVLSGGKSVHGWFFCEGVPEGELLKFMRFAVSLGADHATWSPCQFVRMPDGQRDNGKRQGIVFFNPGPVKSGASCDG